MKKYLSTIIIVALLVGLISGSLYFLNSNKTNKIENDKEIESNENNTVNDIQNEDDDNGIESKIDSKETLKAPDFTVSDINGNNVKLSEKIGKPIIINFWASWCGFCLNEMPLFEELYKEKGTEIEFIMIDAVNVQGETKEKALNYINENNFTFPIYFDDNMEALYLYGISGFPTTIFIDKNGDIVTGYPGEINEELLNKFVAQILE